MYILKGAFNTTLLSAKAEKFIASSAKVDYESIATLEIPDGDEDAC
jgi:hypothetical protein